MLSTPFVVNGTEYSLRYGYKQQKEIKENAPKILFKGEKDLKFSSPMSILDRLDDMNVQIYLIQKGLEWEDSGHPEKIKFDEAGELRLAYLEAGEADDGSKYNELLELLANALSLNVVGADGKKLREKGEAARKTAKAEELTEIYLAKMIAEERYKARGTTDTSEQPS